MFCFIWLTKQLMLHKFIKNINKLDLINTTQPWLNQALKIKNFWLMQ